MRPHVSASSSPQPGGLFGGRSASRTPGLVNTELAVAGEFRRSVLAERVPHRPDGDGAGPVPVTEPTPWAGVSWFVEQSATPFLFGALSEDCGVTLSWADWGVGWTFVSPVSTSTS